ncbi:MAG: extracellular solute-binding protein [Treponema sp.]|jgi:raffinose/stachyose/melibiose transport system substrate-binding protein|nr:extracellular solute-binding protein [Treponema sp.]
MKKIVCITLALLCLCVYAFAGGKSDGAKPGAAGQVTIKVFTNLPDRKNGQGLVEQIIFDAYMKANPHINITVEALEDEGYKTKFKAYSAGNSMPDLVSTWGQPGFIDEVIDAGLLAELNQADYANYGFLTGSLGGWTKNGKLYGLARNTDVMAFYYNDKLFRDNGWSVPKTYDELVALGKAIRAKGLIPVAMDGQDKWPLYIFLTDIYTKLIGADVHNQQVNAVNTNWNAQVFLDGAVLLQNTAKGGLFQNGFESSDYGTAMNMFTSGQAAMFYMGSWEMSMANNTDFSPEFRENLRAFTMPVIAGGKGKATDICAWNGGGYAVSARSPVKDEAVKLLNYMFLPENWTRIAWENNVCMSAQDFSKYQTGKETPVQKQFISIVTGSSSVSGNPLGDLGTAEFKSRSEDLIQQMASSAITPQEYIKRLD